MHGVTMKFIFAHIFTHLTSKLAIKSGHFIFVCHSQMAGRYLSGII